MSNEKSSGGIGLAGATFLVFLVLRLTHVTAWSWWWVTAPLWGGFGILAGFLVIALPVAVTMDAITRRRRRKAHELKMAEFRKLSGGARERT
jgi:hypothetical protein